jgi:hypothetical protein
MDSRVTQNLWHKKANDYRAKPDKEYRWVWDYARFRFEFTFDNGRRIEEKALALLKFVVAVAAGSWAVFEFLASQGVRATGTEKWLFAGAIICLVVAAGCALKVYQPVQHIVPLTEEVALQAVDERPNAEAALAAFSLTLAAATEGESELNTERSRYLRFGVVSALIAALLFICALSLGVFQKKSPPSPGRAGQSAQVWRDLDAQPALEGCASLVLVRRSSAAFPTRGTSKLRAEHQFI